MRQKSGRPPKPPELRLATGTHRADRHGPKEAIGVEKVLLEVPRVPDESKREEFRRRWTQYCSCLIDVGRLTNRDLPAIEWICDVHQDYFDAQQQIKEAADQYPTSPSGIARHPAFVTLERCRKCLADELPNLGFGPSGRARFPAVASTTQPIRAIQALNRKS